jgi:carboxymethylenebutenolidase
MRKVPGILQPILTAAGIDHDIKVYPEAGHGFLNDHAPDDLPRLDKVIAVLVAAGYHEPSSRDARRRIVAFFRGHLGGVPAVIELPRGGVFLR